MLSSLATSQKQTDRRSFIPVLYILDHHFRFSQLGIRFTPAHDNDTRITIGAFPFGYRGAVYTHC